MKPLLIALTMACLMASIAAAQPSPPLFDSEMPEDYKEKGDSVFDIGDFVAPITDILHYTDRAAYELWLIFLHNGSFIDEDTLPLHRALRSEITDREKLYAMLRLATLHQNMRPLLPNNHGSIMVTSKEGLTEPDGSTVVPTAFYSRKNLGELRDRAEFNRELYRKLLIHSKVSFNYRNKNTGEKVHGKHIAVDAEGHPASFMSVEMRRTVRRMGYPIHQVRGTAFQALEPPSHLGFRIHTSDLEFASAIRDAKDHRPLGIEPPDYMNPTWITQEERDKEWQALMGGSSKDSTE